MGTCTAGDPWLRLHPQPISLGSLCLSPHSPSPALSGGPGGSGRVGLRTRLVSQTPTPSRLCPWERAGGGGGPQGGCDCRLLTPSSPLAPLSPGQDLVPEQAFQVQEDHEAELERARRGPPAPHRPLPLLTQCPPALGHPHAGQRASPGPQQLHQQLRRLVPAAPAGQRPPRPHDVTRPRLQRPPAPGRTVRGNGLCHPRGAREPSRALGEASEWRRKRRRKVAVLRRDLDIARSITEQIGSGTSSVRPACGTGRSLRPWTRGRGDPGGLGRPQTPQPGFIYKYRP